MTHRPRSTFIAGLAIAVIAGCRTGPAPAASPAAGGLRTADTVRATDTIGAVGVPVQAATRPDADVVARYRPSRDLGPLFRAMQLGGVFDDSKTAPSVRSVEGVGGSRM